MRSSYRQLVLTIEGMSVDLDRERRRAEAAEQSLSTMRKALEAIRDYEPSEIVKDDFAYDRMVDAYRNAAKSGLATLAATEPAG